MSIDCVRSTQGTAFVCAWNCFGAPRVAPGIDSAIRSLRSILPLPLVGQTFSSPGSVRASVFQRNPGYRFVAPAVGIGSVLPIMQKVQIILRVIMRCIQKSLKLFVRYRVLIDPEHIHVHFMQMVAAWR